MTAEIIDGKYISSQIRNELSAEVASLHSKTGHTPGLAVVLVGDDPASATYVRNKGIACDEVGITSETILLPSTSNEEDVRLNLAPIRLGFMVVKKHLKLFLML